MVYLLTEEERNRLEQHYPELKNKDPYLWCPTCKKRDGCTYRWRGEVHQCDCVEQLGLLKRYLISGVGKPAARWQWDDWFGDPDALAAAKAYLADEDYVDDGAGLFFWGDQGTGKTMLTTMIVKSLIKRGVRCYVTTFNATVEAFTAGWKSDEDKRWYEANFIRSPVLLLDDIGKERWGRSGLPQNTFDNLLRERVQAGRPTFLTTNMTPDEIKHGYGDGVRDLVDEQCLKHHFVGSSHREQLAERRAQEKTAGERRPIV